MQMMPFLPSIIYKFCDLFPDGARELVYIAYYCWFTFTIVGLFLLITSVIKKVLVIIR